MPSRPASQLADDGEADGTPVPPAYDPSSAEPLPHRDGARKSVGPPPIGRNPNGGKGAGTLCRDAAAGGCEVHFRRQDLRSETDESRIHSQISRIVWEQSGQSLIEWIQVLAPSC